MGKSSGGGEGSGWLRRNHSKHVGEMAEMQFMLDASRRGFGSG